jgi:hypothetical protein
MTQCASPRETSSADSAVTYSLRSASRAAAKATREIIDPTCGLVVTVPQSAFTQVRDQNIEGLPAHALIIGYPDTRMVVVYGSSPALPDDHRTFREYFESSVSTSGIPGCRRTDTARIWKRISGRDYCVNDAYDDDANGKTYHRVYCTGVITENSKRWYIYINFTTPYPQDKIWPQQEEFITRMKFPQ